MENTKDVLKTRRNLPMLIRAKEDAVKNFAGIKKELVHFGCEFGEEYISVALTELSAELDDAKRFNAEVDVRIKSLKDESVRRIFIERYSLGKGWEDVAEDVGYALSHVHRLHKRGLKVFKSC